MMARLRSHLTFANVVSLMALFAALSGGAYALTIPKNTIGAKQIKKNAVRASEIRKGAVRSSEVKDRSLLSRDFRPGQLPAGPAGSRGPAGPKGAQGQPGATYSTIPGGGLRLNASNQFGLAACPNSEVLKSNGSGYACAADDDSPDLDSIDTTHVINGSLRADDLGPNVGIGTDPDPVNDGDCIGGQALDVVPGATVGDPVLTSTLPAALPVGVIFDAAMTGPGDVQFQICNFTGAQYDPPDASYLITAVAYE